LHIKRVDRFGAGFRAATAISSRMMSG
jgi:hypothetical protein